MEESKRLVFSLLMIILPLVYFAFFQIDQWKTHFTTWDVNLGSESMHDDVEKDKEPLDFLLRKLVRGEQRKQLENIGFAFVSELHSDLYVSRKEMRFDTNSSKVYIHSNQELQQYKVQPYAQKDDEGAMTLVTPVEIQHGDVNLQACNYIHDVPAIIFSSGGFVGNTFHQFNDVIIPLYITSRHFRSRVKFVVTDFHLWFINKYKNIFNKLSGYEVINAADRVNGTVHCFPGGVVGLKYHGYLSLNKSDIPGGYTMFEFRDFLTRSYNLKIKDVSQLMESKKPELLLLSRTETRAILNQDEVVNMMEDLGFRVVISTMNMMLNLEEFVHIINTCSVIVGVHGAGLTNELFLPNGAVMIQVVPLGLDWPGNACFGSPAEGMGLHYLEYKIEPQESSLFGLYGPDHPVIENPESMKSQGYLAFRAVYLDKQNVKINVERFRKTLVDAMRLLGRLNEEILE